MKVKSYLLIIILIFSGLINLNCSNKNKSIDDLVNYFNSKGLEAERRPIRTLYSLIGATSGGIIIVSSKDENGKYHTLSFETYKFPTIEQAESWSKTANAINSIQFGCFVMYPHSGWKNNFENNELYQKVKIHVRKF